MQNTCIHSILSFKFRIKEGGVGSREYPIREILGQKMVLHCCLRVVCLRPGYGLAPCGCASLVDVHGGMAGAPWVGQAGGKVWCHRVFAWRGEAGK